MSNDDILTDDYVAELLAKEAKDCSLKYSSMGLEAFRSNKKPADKPKPNTRFLRHIIRDTNTHNANLLAREAAEAQARLQSLESVEEQKKKKRAGPQDIRRRQMGDINAILGARKAKPNAGGVTRSTEAKPAEEGRSLKRRHRDSRSVSPEEGSSRRRRRSRLAESDSDHKDSKRHRRHRRRDGSEDDKEDHHRRKTIDKSDSTRHRRRSRSPKEQERKFRARSPIKNDDLASRSRGTEKSSRDHNRDLFSGRGRQSVLKDKQTSDSDPLDDIIGPAPPPTVRARGRGTLSGSSGIDRRFEDGYDPKSDVQPDEDVNDWDEAVEVFRDRQKWRQNQEERMRAAGFGDDEIKKWKKGGERNEDDVRWAKVGEKREWDRGKEGELRGLFSEND